MNPAQPYPHEEQPQQNGHTLFSWCITCFLLPVRTVQQPASIVLHPYVSGSTPLLVGPRMLAWAPGAGQVLHIPHLMCHFCSTASPSTSTVIVSEGLEKTPKMILMPVLYPFVSCCVVIPTLLYCTLQYYCNLLSQAKDFFPFLPNTGNT